MLQALIASVGAGAVVPGLAAQHPFTHHLADPLAIDQADAKTKSARAGAYKPEFLDRHQFETLESLAERIVPGSARAKASEFVDQLLAIDAPEDQRSFLNALGAIEGKALARSSKPWKQLPEADQIAILTEVSTMASGRPPDRSWTKGDPIAIGREPAPPVTLTLRDHFDLLKAGSRAHTRRKSECGRWVGLERSPTQRIRAANTPAATRSLAARPRAPAAERSSSG
jgi:hypothetical protein